MKNVLLINTSYRKSHESQYATFGPPMGLLSIASSLKSHGYAVELIDPQIDTGYLDKLDKALTKSQLFVGMSTYLGENIRHAVELSKLIKSKNQDLPLVLGGPMASSIPDIFFSQMPVDYIVMGAGESTVIKLADALYMSKDMQKIGNISYMHDGKVIIGELSIFEGNLDKLPQPDLEAWEVGISNMRSIPIITSRGCHRGCAFCYNTFSGKRKFYLRSPESVINEMERWNKRFNLSSFQFFDDNFLLDSHRAMTILDEIKKRKWKIERLFGHLNEFAHVTPEQFGSCVTLIVMCIESASLRIQKLLNKRIDLEKAYDVIERIVAQKIKFVTAFMFGLPTETDEDIRLSIESAVKIRNIKETNISMCYIYAPQPKDAIVKSLGSNQHVNFSLEAVSNVEVVPVPPDNKLDLQLRPWMRPDDQRFYLDFVQVWQYHFAYLRDPNFNLALIYSKNKRVRNLFKGISSPSDTIKYPILHKKFTELKFRLHHVFD